jgi:hypothetical protein
MHTAWRRFDQGGLDDIKEWCESHPDRRLIWIDTLAKLRPLANRNEQAYAADYRAIEGLQKLAGEYQVGIVLNHHLRKAASEDDAFDDVSGTLGLTGAADTIIVMKRHAGMVKVFVRGRDIEEAEFAAEFNKQTCRWRLVGEADEVFRSEQRQAISTALKETKRPMSVAEIMAATERRDRNSTEVLLHKMERDGEVKHVGRGLWAHPDIKAEPTESVKIVKKVRNNNQGTDSQEKNGTDESYRNLNADETVKIPGKISEAASPLTNNGKSPGSYHLNDLTSSERADVLGDRCSVEVPMEGIKKENAEEDEESEAAQPSPLLPPDLHLNTSTPPCGGVRPPPTADVEICAQCGAADPGPLLHVLVAEGKVRLHRECRRFWLCDHPQPKGTVIPCVQIAEVAATLATVISRTGNGASKPLPQPEKTQRGFEPPALRDS